MTREEIGQLLKLVHDIDTRLTRVDERLGTALQTTKDHEKRLRAGERWRYLRDGALGALGGVLGGVAGAMTR